MYVVMKLGLDAFIFTEAIVRYHVNANTDGVRNL